MASTCAVTTYAGPAGDHNDRAAPACLEVGEALGERLGVSPVVVGEPVPARPAGWQAELERARPTLEEMSRRTDDVLHNGQVPVSAITRCAVALATVSVVLRHHPGTVVVWLDAHGDINVPANTTTDYLGGMALSGPLGWWESGFGGVADSQAVLVGARDLDSAERAHVDAGRITMVSPGPDVGDRLAEAVAGRPVYFHLDCDVMDPGLFATDYRVAGGLTLDDRRACAEAAALGGVVGLEIAEYEGAGTAGVPDLLDALAPVLR